MDEAHGYDHLLIKAIKILILSVSFLLKVIFESVINEGVFPKD